MWPYLTKATSQNTTREGSWKKVLSYQWTSPLHVSPSQSLSVAQRKQMWAVNEEQKSAAMLTLMMDAGTRSQGACTAARQWEPVSKYATPSRVLEVWPAHTPIFLVLAEAHTNRSVSFKLPSLWCLTILTIGKNALCNSERNRLLGFRTVQLIFLKACLGGKY